MACQTCNIIRGLLLAEGVPAPIIEAGMPYVARAERKVKKTVKRKASAYSRRYAAAFKKVAKKYKKKSGGWMKDGFKRAQKEAHRLAKRG